MNKIKLIFSCICPFLFSFFFSYAQHADLIIFSYHRPLQLYALLESVESLMTDIGKISVLYRADNQSFEDGYEVVKNKFSSVSYIRQSPQPYQDFKPLLMKILAQTNKYVLFAVDDIIVKEPVDLAYCIKQLEKHQAYGFYLRLGTHVDFCYSENKHQGIPPITYIEDDLYSWQFNQGSGDWHYPNTVDMTLYRTASIIEAFESLNFNSPNSLEGWWATKGLPSLSQKGLCFASSKMVNIPLNVIQKDWGNYQQGNRHMQGYSCEQLLEIFNQGLKIDVKQLLHIKNRSAHIDFVPTFIAR